MSMAGAVLNTINCRLDARGVATILRHAEPKVFFVDCQFVPLAKDALRLLLHDNNHDSPHQLPLVVVIDDLSSPTGTRLGNLEYEQILQRQLSRRRSEPNCRDREDDDDILEGVDEWDPIALNYTSGTTSAPKGVVYSHRGAYVSSMSILMAWEMGTHPVYLWSLPMFHCNGWALTWGVAARGGTNICLRHITAPQIYRNIALHRVTHMCCAPVVFNILMEREKKVNNVSERAGRAASDGPVVHILTGGAPPPPAKIQQIEAMGFQVTHAYGLTEATGVALVCEWQRAWDELPAEEQGWLKVRQGVSSLGLADVDVKDTDTMASVPRDGKTMGEIVLRGSSIMKGYFKDHEATRKAFKGGWLLTGDVGVVHPDGYVQIKDRSKDVIISGGENISSVEVENVIHRYPGVKEVAVVAIPHPRWGESPCAFVALASSCQHGPNKNKMTETATEADLLSYCRANMPGFMVPKKVVLLNDDEELPKTSTGKIEKVKLRALAKGLVNAQDSVSLPRKMTSTAAYQHDLQIHALSRL